MARRLLQSSLGQPVVKEIEIPIPPINEQNRIVEKIETLFSEIDAGVESLSKAKTQLERYRQSFAGVLRRPQRDRAAIRHGNRYPLVTHRPTHLCPCG